jgi:hypothetical protein
MSGVNETNGGGFVVLDLRHASREEAFNDR